MINVQITDAKEIDAFNAGEISGEQFNDGEIWVSEESLLRWMARPKNVEAETAYVAQ